MRRVSARYTERGNRVYLVNGTRYQAPGTIHIMCATEKKRAFDVTVSSRLGLPPSTLGLIVSEARGPTKARAPFYRLFRS